MGIRIGLLGLGAAGLAIAAQPAAAQRGVLSMTCNPIYKGNDLGPQVYRLEGVELIKTDPSASSPIVLSSAVRRAPLGRTIDKGVTTETAASHRLRGPVLTRTVWWATGGKPAAARFTETYDFAAKTIRRPNLPLERCR